MLTPERLSEVTFVLGKLADALAAVERLLGGEPVSQPPTDRARELEKVAVELEGIERRLEGLFS